MFSRAEITGPPLNDIVTEYDRGIRVYIIVYTAKKKYNHDNNNNGCNYWKKKYRQKP